MQRVTRNLTILLFATIATTWWLARTRIETAHPVTPATVPAADQGLETLSPAMQQAVTDFQRRSQDLKTLNRILVPAFDANPPTPAEIGLLLQTLHQRPVNLPTRDDATAQMPTEDARLRQRIKGPTQRELLALRTILLDVPSFDAAHRELPGFTRQEYAERGMKAIKGYLSTRGLMADRIEPISEHIVLEGASGEILFFHCGGTKAGGQHVDVCIVASPDSEHALADPQNSDLPIVPSKLMVIETPVQAMEFVRLQMATADDGTSAGNFVKVYLLLNLALNGASRDATVTVQPHPKSDGFEVFGRAVPPDGKPGHISVLFTFVDGKLTYVVEERGEDANLTIARTSY